MEVGRKPPRHLASLWKYFGILGSQTSHSTPNSISGKIKNSERNDFQRIPKHSKTGPRPTPDPGTARTWIQATWVLATWDLATWVLATWQLATSHLATSHFLFDWLQSGNASDAIPAALGFTCTHRQDITSHRRHAGMAICLQELSLRLFRV